jgi:hypothetical protein
MKGHVSSFYPTKGSTLADSWEAVCSLETGAAGQIKSITLTCCVFDDSYYGYYNGEGDKK